jgi:hypothetical protein
MMMTMLLLLIMMVMVMMMLMIFYLATPFRYFAATVLLRLCHVTSAACTATVSFLKSSLCVCWDPER